MMRADLIAESAYWQAIEDDRTRGMLERAGARLGRIVAQRRLEELDAPDPGDGVLLFDGDAWVDAGDQDDPRVVAR